MRRFNGTTAVETLDLDIPKGEIYGFLGPNGAGKSTTVRVLCTLLTPSEGRAVVAGHDVAVEPEQVRLRIGVALQEAALDPKQTGVQLLRLQGRLYGLTRSEIWAIVRELRRSGTTILLTTQYLEEADELADRVGIINDGRLVAEGTPSDLKRSVGNDVIVARLDGRAAAAREGVERVHGVHGVEVHGEELVITAADGAATIGAVAVALNGVTAVRHLTLRTPTLDDVFLELTGNRIENESERAQHSEHSELVEVGQ